MISLKDYVLKKLILEMNLQSEDFDKHDYLYTKGLIDFLINGTDIKLGKKGEKGTFNGNKLSSDEIEKLKKLQTKLNNDEDITMNEFNNAIISSKLKYSSFFKGQFSGYEGQTMGQMFESFTCYIYNNDKYNIDDWAKFMKIEDTNTKEFKSWEESSVKQLELMKEYISDYLKENPNDYIAYHVDGNDFNTPNDFEKYLILAKLFRGKTEIVKINKNAKDIYVGKNKGKDKWNPADIVLIKKISDEELELIISALQQCVNGDAFNAKLVELLGSNIILPISLKKVTKTTGKVLGHNIKNARELDKHKIDLSYIRLGAKYKYNDDRGSMVVFGVNTDLDEKTEIQFRRSTNKNPSLVIELMLQSKIARGGKGISMVKQKLGLPNNNSYFKEFKSNEELFNFFADNGFKDSQSHLIEDIPDNIKNVDLYNRVCYKGFCGVFNKYKEVFRTDLKDKTKDEIIQLFTEFIYLSCVDCPGSYYIIK